MSADDWIPCPFCSRLYEGQITKLKSLIKEGYETMTAKEYDEFKSKAEAKMRELDKEQQEKAYLRVDGTSNYWFDEDGIFHSGISASCPHCKREWKISGKAEPNSENRK